MLGDEILLYRSCNKSFFIDLNNDPSSINCMKVGGIMANTRKSCDSKSRTRKSSSTTRKSSKKNSSSNRTNSK